MTPEEFHVEFKARRYKLIEDKSVGDEVSLIIELEKNKQTYHITAEREGDDLGDITISRVTLGPVTITLDAGLWSFIIQCLDDQALDLVESENYDEEDDLVERTRDAAIELRRQLEKDYD